MWPQQSHMYCAKEGRKEGGITSLLREITTLIMPTAMRILLTPSDSSQKDTDYNFSDQSMPAHARTCCMSAGSRGAPAASMASSASRCGRRSGAASNGEGSCSTAMLSTASDSGSHPRITARSAVFASGCEIAFSLT